MRPGNSWDLRSCRQQPGESLREYIRQLFKTTDMAFIHCGHFPENLPSEKLLRGLGFREFSRHTAGKKEIVDEVFFR